MNLDIPFITAEQLAFLSIPVILLVSVIVAIVVAKKGNPLDVAEQSLETKPELQEVRELAHDMREIVEKLNALPVKEEPQAVPEETPPKPEEPIDMEKVLPAPKNTVNNEGRFVAVGKAAMPLGIVVLFVMYQLNGYVKIPNYAADAQGFNDRLGDIEYLARTTENTTIPQVSNSLASLTVQTNVFNAGLTSVNTTITKALAEQEIRLLGASQQQVTSLQKQISDLQSELVKVKASVANLTANTTSNVSGNITH